MNLKWMSGGLKTPLSRARGLGSAKSGVHHWIMQRLTAISNLVLGLWFMCAMLCVSRLDYAQTIEWLSQPVHAILMILFVMSSFYHAVLGLQVVVEDYIHNELLKIVKLFGQKLIFFGLAVACIFSILKVAL